MNSQIYKNFFYKRGKIFLLLELIVIFLALVFLFFINKPKQIYPLDGMAVSNDNFIFEIENGDQVLISNNPNFTNSIVLYENSEIILPPGKYFWKVRNNFRESEVESFIITEKVGLEINKKDNILWNSGNVDLNVSDDRGIIGFVLEKGKIKKIKENNITYIGEKNE